MRRFQAKKYKIRTYEIGTISCQMMKFIGWLIFTKIVLQAVKRFKKVAIKKKRLKKILLMEKDCDNGKRL